MQFLFQGRPKPEVLNHRPDNFMDAVRGDWAKTKEYYTQGIFRQIWTTETGAMVLCEAESIEQLEALINDLPMAKANLIDIEIHALTPYRGFAQ